MTRIKILLKKFVETNIIEKKKLLTIVENDPTSKQITKNDDGEYIEIEDIKVGKYTNWVIQQFLEIRDIEKHEGRTKDEIEQYEHLFFEDLYKTKEDLIKFDRFKGRLPLSLRDINSLTIDTLYDNVSGFSLLEATTTKGERRGSLYHPGANVVHETDKWLIMEIRNNDALGKEAAVYYGGFNEETRWCTSAPGMDYFSSYVVDGPLYIFLNKEDTDLGVKTGLPMERYQIHFQSNQFMDKHDRSFDFVKFLQERCDDDIRFVFKECYYQGVVNKGKVSITNNEKTIKNISTLYGLDDFFEYLPNDIEKLNIETLELMGSEIKIDEKLYKFTELTELYLNHNVIKGTFDLDLSYFPNLKTLSLRDNPELHTFDWSFEKYPSIEIYDLGKTGIEIREEYREIMSIDNFYDRITIGDLMECGMLKNKDLEKYRMETVEVATA